MHAFITSAAVLGMCALFACAGQSDVHWQEGEDYSDAPQGLEEVTQPRLPGSGGESSTGATYGKPEYRMTYSFTLPADLPEARLVLRYARLHWRETMKPVNLVCELTMGGKTGKHVVTCGNTGGWGTKVPKDWQLTGVDLGAVTKGPATLVIHSEEGAADVNVDGFFVAPVGLKLTAEEFNGLNRVLISGKGYIGIDQMYSAVEQQAFTGFNIIGRGFIPHTEKVSVILADAAGNETVVFYKDAPLTMADGQTKLEVSADAVRKVPDGTYTLRVTWGTDGALLEMPFVTMGNLAVQAQQEVDALNTYIAENGKSGNKAVRRIMPDLRYAVDYINNALVLLRSRRHADQPESAFKAALAYFEKSRQRTAENFADDLRTIVAQTKETMARVAGGKDPYAGRTGDFRRAFVSAKTKKLEPYRIYIPKAYGAGTGVPVILMLHGGGGDENSFPDQENGDVLKVLEERGVVGIAPKATSWYGEDKNSGDDGIWDMGQLVKLVIKEYPGIDPEQAYCTGVSRGGFGTYRVTYNHPGLFRAVASVSGIGSKKFTDVKKLGTTPVLIIHGGSDTVVPITVAKEMAEKLTAAGVPNELKVFPTYGHNYHGREYLEYSLDWFEKMK